MKRKAGIISGLCLFLFICQGVFAAGEKDGKRQVDIQGERLSYSELYVYFDAVRGTTQVTFFNVPRTYQDFTKSKNSSLFESYFYTDRYSLISERVTKENKQINYTCILQARSRMFHRENLSTLLSNILRRPVTVTDAAVAPTHTHLINIAFNYDEDMYIPAGNSAGIYYNEYSRQILYSYDIAKAPIEFLLGYRY